jgi:hypothetical protein
MINKIATIVIGFVIICITFSSVIGKQSIDQDTFHSTPLFTITSDRALERETSNNPTTSYIGDDLKIPIPISSTNQSSIFIECLYRLAYEIQKEPKFLNEFKTEHLNKVKYDPSLLEKYNIAIDGTNIGEVEELVLTYYVATCQWPCVTFSFITCTIMLIAVIINIIIGGIGLVIGAIATVFLAILYIISRIIPTIGLC